MAGALKVFFFRNRPSAVPVHIPDMAKTGAIEPRARHFLLLTFCGFVLSTGSICTLATVQ